MEELEAFLAEGTLMIDFKHENVMALVGVVWEEGDRPLVILPFMENGDLKSLIQSPEVVSPNLCGCCHHIEQSNIIFLLTTGNETRRYSTFYNANRQRYGLSV